MDILELCDRIGVRCRPTKLNRRLTVVPLYSGDEEAAEAKKIGEYDPDAQIHAGWLLAYAGSMLSEEEHEHVFSQYEAIGYQLRNFGKGEKVTYAKDGADAKRRKGGRG